MTGMSEWNILKEHKRLYQTQISWQEIITEERNIHGDMVL